MMMMMMSCGVDKNRHKFCQNWFVGFSSMRGWNLPFTCTLCCYCVTQCERTEADPMCISTAEICVCVAHFQAVLTAAERRRRVCWISAVIRLHHRLGRRHHLVAAADLCRSLGRSQPNKAVAVMPRWHGWLTSVEMMTTLQWRSLVDWKSALRREWTASRDEYVYLSSIAATMTVRMWDWCTSISLWICIQTCYKLVTCLGFRFTGIFFCNDHR